MKKRLISSLLFIVFITVMLCNSVYAADSVTLNDIPDKKPGESVVISGSASLDEVSVLIICPDSTKLYFNVLDGGLFTDTITLPADAAAGTYTVKAGAGSVMASKTFRVVSGTDTPTPPDGGNNGGNSGGNSGGGQSSGSGTNNTASSDGSTTIIQTVPGQPVNVKLPAPVVDTVTKQASSIISSDILNKAFDAFKGEGIKTIAVDIPLVQGVKAYALSIPAAIFTASGEERKIEVKTEFGTVSLPSNMLQADYKAAKTVELVIENVDKSQLSKENRNVIGDKPAVDISLRVDGNIIKWSNPDKPVTVSIPYTATAFEAKNPQFIIAWYIDDTGNRIVVPNSRYSADKKVVSFTVTHFSKYAVAFIMKSFEDVKSEKWYAPAVVTVASYGFAQGTSDTVFSPDKAVTRGEYLGWLIRTLGLTSEVKSNFSDVPEAYKYSAEIGTAKALKITAGTGENKFSPNANISRQDLMVLTVKAIQAAKGELPSKTPVDLKKFSDAGKIAKYAVNDVSAMIASGYVGGSTNNRLNPQMLTTRAEAAQILYNIFNSYK